MEFGILSLFPAIVTIIVAIIFRKVALALFLGMVAGAFVFADFALGIGFQNIGNYLIIAFTDMARLKIVLFLLLIGAMLKIIGESGGYHKFANSISTKLNTPRKSRLTTWFLSFMLFFDDYANVLISGASMRTINEKNGVSRAFLAYMVDVLAVMASIMLISTWASFEGSVMVDAGKQINSEQSATFFFLNSLPYHFYTIFAIFLTFLVAYSGKWFGYRADTMKFEEKGSNTIDLSKIKNYHVIVPFVSLILLAVIGLFVIGYIIVLQNGDEISLINIIGNAPSIEILIGSSVISILFVTILLLKDKVLEFKEISKSFFVGMKEMVEVCLVIIMATGLSAVSDDLKTGEYIANSITAFLTPELIPFLVYLISMLITAATGFSWSSMAIVMPIAFQLVTANQMPEFIPVVSAAVICGAVSGEHFIPYSEKAVMTAAACKITPVYHLKTQILQTIAAFTAGSMAFLLIGYKFNTVLVYLLPLMFLFSLHFLFARNSKQISYVAENQ